MKIIRQRNAMDCGPSCLAIIAEKKQERSYELRSEKVRSIVGQIPSSLIRYGITAIGVVLLCLFVVGYFLPYKQVYPGTATINRITNTAADSVE